MPDVTIYLMVGLPGSGKTDWLQYRGLLNSETPREDSHEVISQSDIRKNILIENGIPSNALERFEEREVEVYHTMINNIVDALQTKTEIYVDAQLYSKKARDNLIKAIKFKNIRHYDIRYIVIYLPCDAEKAWEKISQKEGYDQILPEVFNRFVSSLEEPTNNEESFYAIASYSKNDNGEYNQTKLSYYKGYLIRQNSLTIKEL